MPFIEDIQTNIRGTGAYQAASRHWNSLSPGARTRFGKYGGIAKRGFIEAWGFERHATRGGVAGLEEARRAGRGAIHSYHKLPGKWRFMGLGGKGGRIDVFKANRKAGFGKALWKALPGHSLMLGAFTGYAMYSGYKKEGLWGAAKGGVHATVELAAFDVVLSALGAAAAPLEGLALGAGAGYGIYKALDYGAQRTRQKRQLEFGGTPIDDQFGTIATMRQRSLLEMQRSHGALRGALGTEAQFFNL